MNTSPATMRRMLSIRPVHGDLDGSNIDIRLTPFSGNAPTAAIREPGSYLLVERRVTESTLK
jgi:hypothetical protein